MNPKIKKYIEENILTRYDNFSDGHDRSHVESVISTAVSSARELNLDENIAYTAAAYHDVGIDRGRKFHHVYSREFFLADENIKEFFTPEELDIIADAIEDHRASSDKEPRSIYGRIVADADHAYDCRELIRRTVLFGNVHYPELSDEEKLERAYSHLSEKYGPEGYIHFFLETDSMRKEREAFYTMLENKEQIYEECRKYL